MTKKRSMASQEAIPLCALVIYLISLFYYQFPAIEVHAKIISGLLSALTPISIIAGAIFLFRCMEHSGALAQIKVWLNGVSTHSIAQLMIVGWAFSFLIEGISGFGTPAAIAAPILFSLGFPAVKVAVFCLILNTVPVTFGAVGAPIWFGMSVINISENDLAGIAKSAALINAAIAPFIVILGLLFVVEKASIVFRNLLFIMLSIFACTLPFVIASHFSIEFPTVIGGTVGIVITILLAKYSIGIDSKDAEEDDSITKIGGLALLKASFPLWGTVVLLFVSRIEEFGLQQLLRLSQPALQFDIPLLGELSISVSLVFTLSNILGTQESWNHSLLYIPSILPFVVIGFMTLIWFNSASSGLALEDTKTKMKYPFISLLAAMAFVNLMMMGEEKSAVQTIGLALSSFSQEYWTFFAPFLGALGSFFSGSATISNLTFAGIQLSIAKQLSLDSQAILALQAVGATMGNMVCINNIVAVSSVLGLHNRDGEILKRSFLILLVYGVMAGLFGILVL
ncbi:L-lactate permease [Ningiella sp. W23]|uniref:L-lactate permease n=1 Tax=Ningiella sp. W23 TaxID=3023715 RepID=UPI0037579CF1